MEPVVAAVAQQFHDVHQQLRGQIAGLDSEALNWVPAPDANSIAVLVIHTLGSEGDTLRVVRGVPSHRDRPAEFMSKVDDNAELSHRLDEADQLLNELAPAITIDDLATQRVRAASPEPQTGIYWLVQNCAHAREHLGHISLTKQLWLNR